MNNLKMKDKTGVKLFLLFFALIFIRYCYYGFTYYYQLDDYIQYHNYNAYNESAIAAINKLGLLAARPLAGLADICVWSTFFSCMIVALAIISALYAFSGCLFQKVFSEKFGTSYFFLAVYCLLPFGFEGTYWISASSRIIVGLFFSALSFYSFQKWCDKKKWYMFLLFAVAQLISFGFYEQVIVLSITLTMLFMILNWKKKSRHVLAGLFWVVNAYIYMLVTNAMSKSALYSERMSLFLPWDKGYRTAVWTSLISQLHSSFIEAPVKIFTKGFKRGFDILTDNPNFLYIIAVVLLCLGVYLLCKKKSMDRPVSILPVFVGLILAIAPVTPFFVLENPWFSIRGTVMSFCGIALAADSLLLMITQKWGGRRAFGVVTVIFTAICCISSISEIHDYRLTTVNDTKMVNMIIASLDENEDLNDMKKVGILNLESTYLDDINIAYHEHIHGVTESRWALSGAVSCLAGREGYPQIYPFAQSERMYAPYEAEECRLDTFDKLYYYDEDDERLIPVTIQQYGDLVYEYSVVDEEENIIAYTWEANENGYLRQSD